MDTTLAELEKKRKNSWKINTKYFLETATLNNYKKTTREKKKTNRISHFQDFYYF